MLHQIHLQSYKYSLHSLFKSHLEDEEDLVVPTEEIPIKIPKTPEANLPISQPKEQAKQVTTPVLEKKETEAAKPKEAKKEDAPAKPAESAKDTAPIESSTACVKNCLDQCMAAGKGKNTPDMIQCMQECKCDTTNKNVVSKQQLIEGIVDLLKIYI